MTFCQWARRIVICASLLIAAWQGITVSYSTPATIKLHLITAGVFALVALIVLIFDVWWDTRTRLGLDDPERPPCQSWWETWRNR